MRNQNQNNNISFSKNPAPIIAEIMEKHNLKESEEEFLKKIEKDKPINDKIILDLTIKIAEGKASPKRLPLLLEKELDISPKKAREVATDIEEKLLILTKKGLPEEKKAPTIKRKDIYREPIE